MAKKQSKRYREALAKVPAGTVAIREGVEIVNGFGANKFDATVELGMHLGIDPKQADQGIRGSISLPHRIGATRKVVAFSEEGKSQNRSCGGPVPGQVIGLGGNFFKKLCAH